jgi:hypothetical protein
LEGALALNNKGQALIIVLKFLAVLHLLKEGYTLLTDMEPFLLPIVLVYLWLNVVLWRPRPEGFYLISTFVAFQFLNYLYWFVTSTFLLPIIAYSQESKLLWGVLTVFYALMLGWTYRARAELGYCKTTSRTRSIGVVVVTLTILMFSGYLTMDAMGQSGHEVIRFPGQNILHGVLTPNGKYLAIDRMDNKYHHSTVLWDTKQKAIIKTLFTGETLVGITASPNSKYIAIVGAGTKVWDIETGSLLKNIDWDRKNNRGMHSGSFSVDSKDFAYGTQEGIRILSLNSNDVSDIIIPSSLENISGATFAVSYSPDGLTIAAARKKEIVLWDLKRKQSNGVIKSGLRTISNSIITFSPDGRYLTLTGYSEFGKRAVEIIDILQRKSLGDFNIDTQINAVEFAPNGRFVAIGSINRVVDLIDVKELKKKRLRGSHPFSAVYFLAFSPDGKILYTGGGAELKIWNLTGHLN